MTWCSRYVNFSRLSSTKPGAGNDPMAANLTAIMAYYVNIILRFDYDSFSAAGILFSESLEHCEQRTGSVGHQGMEIV